MKNVVNIVRKEVLIMVAVNEKQVKKQIENRYTPWSVPWMRIHFNYNGFIMDENYIPKHDYKFEKSLRLRITKFAKTRDDYRYTEIKSNSRDLGGYLTKDKKYRTKSGLLIRSNRLNDMSMLGKQMLKDLDVSKIIDLRDLHEAYNHPDDKSLDLSIDLDPVYTNKGVNRNRSDTFNYGVINRYHSLLFDNEHAMNAYNNVLHTFIYNRGAVIYHCTEGRDRTGLVSALLLSALGVSKHTIFNDYLLTNYYTPARPFSRQYRQLQTFFNACNSEFGGVHGYLNALGVSDYDIKLLKNKFLEKNQ